MNSTHIIEKYTEIEVDTRAMHEHKDYRVLAETIETTARRLERTEDQLRESVRLLRKVADKIESNVDAASGDAVYSLNSLGELQSDRTDQLIAVRAEQIETLRGLALLTLD